MGFLSRAVGQRIARTLDEIAQTPEGQAAIERQERFMNLAEAAREVAGSGLGDDEACADLRGRLPEDADVAPRAIEHLGALRTSYLDDRAYRLLTAFEYLASLDPERDPIMNTDLATSIVREYRAVTRGGRSPDSDPTCRSAARMLRACPLSTSLCLNTSGSEVPGAQARVCRRCDRTGRLH
jgi:hypothetical protein